MSPPDDTTTGSAQDPERPSMQGLWDGPPVRAVVIDVGAVRDGGLLRPAGTGQRVSAGGAGVIAEAAAHANIPVYGLSSGGWWDAGPLVFNTDLHLDAVVTVPIRTERAHGFAIPPTPDWRAALQELCQRNTGLELRDLLLVGPTGGALQQAYGGTNRIDPDAVDDDPDIHTNPSLGWAVRTDWVVPENDHDPDDLVDLLLAGRIHPYRRAWAQHHAAGMTAGFSPHTPWPGQLMTRKEAWERPWEAVALAAAMYAPPAQLRLWVAGAPVYAIGRYDDMWMVFMRWVKDWHRRQGTNRSGRNPRPDLLFVPAAIIAADIVRRGWRPAIVPVPAHQWSEDRPGQTSERLAGLVARLTGLPYRRCLERDRGGGYQLAAKPPAGPVVLIDDQITSGTTLRRCARLLDSNDLKRCYAITASGSHWPQG